MHIRIEYLADCESHIPVIAAWQHSQFGYLNPAVTIEQRTTRLRASLQRECLPIALVAVSEEGQPVGAASILPTTITHKHLAPWLSTVFVPSELRRNGIASALSLRALAEAARLGFQTLYLFTPHNESLYAGLGWQCFERSTHNGLAIAIMSRPTSA
jgi:predicted N-acetyltransferase YhbS